jgi:hypothetical protein
MRHHKRAGMAMPYAGKRRRHHKKKGASIFSHVKKMLFGKRHHKIRGGRKHKRC